MFLTQLSSLRQNDSYWIKEQSFSSVSTVHWNYPINFSMFANLNNPNLLWFCHLSPRLHMPTAAFTDTKDLVLINIGIKSFNSSMELI